MSAYVGLIIVEGNTNPPRRLMEAALEKRLKSRNEVGAVTIEYQAINEED